MPVNTARGFARQVSMNLKYLTFWGIEKNFCHNNVCVTQKAYHSPVQKVNLSFITLDNISLNLEASPVSSIRCNQNHYKALRAHITSTTTSPVSLRMLCNVFADAVVTASTSGGLAGRYGNASMSTWADTQEHITDYTSYVWNEVEWQ